MSAGKRYKFQGSSFTVQTGFGTPVNVTGATAADPVVLTATNTFVLGDVVKLSNFDAPTQLDGATYAIDNPLAGSFELAGVDGTGYAAFNAGSPNAVATPVTFSEFCELTGVNQQDGSADEEDVSTICSTAKEFEAGLSDSGTLQLDFNWAGNETVQAALRTAKVAGTTLAFKVAVGAAAAGGTVIMIGTVQQTSFSGQVGQVWKGSATIKLTGEIFVLAAPV